MNLELLKKASLWSALAGFLLLLPPLWMRHRAESANKAVGLAVEAAVINDFASAEGKTFSEALEILKLQGLTGVSYSEETVAELQASGEIRLAREGDLTRILCSDLGSLTRIADAGSRLKGLTVVEGSEFALTYSGSPDLLRALSVGINPQAKEVSAAGLEVIARHGNSVGLDKVSISNLLASSKNLGANWVLPSGDQIPGRRAAQEGFIEALEELNLYYLTPEFAKIGGDAAVREKIPAKTLRLHTIQAVEGDKLTDAAAIERYVKAGRERGIRWLLVRPLSSGGEAPLDTLKELIRKINKGLEHEGLTVSRPHPFTNPDPSVPIPLIYVALSPFFLWVMARGLRGLSFKGAALIVATPVLLILICSAIESMRHLSALGAAVLFPLGALLWALDRESHSPWLEFLVMSALSLLGGLAVAGTLTGIPWMLQNDQFSGIKLAHFFPMIWGGILMISQVADLKKVAAAPILYGSAGLGLLVLVAVAFMLSRTGNDNPAGVSGLELQIRSLLDKVLYTRPRTKEFLIGHPFLIAGLVLLAQGCQRPALKGWGGILMTVGMIGMTSMVNTLCHLHSPLELNLARILIGWVIGGILGGILAWALSKLTAGVGVKGTD